MTYMTTFSIKNILRESTFKVQGCQKVGAGPSDTVSRDAVPE